MALLATVQIVEDYVPLSEDNRAMLIKALREFAQDLSTGGKFEDGNVATAYIQKPELPMLKTLVSNKHGRLR